MSIDCYLLKTSPNNRIRIFGELGFVEYLIEMAESEYSNNLDLGESWAAIHYMLTIEAPTTRPSPRLSRLKMNLSAQQRKRLSLAKFDRYGLKLY